MCVCTPALVPGLSVSLPSTLGEHSLTLFSEVLEGLAFIELNSMCVHGLKASMVQAVSSHYIWE